MDLNFKADQPRREGVGLRVFVGAIGAAAKAAASTAGQIAYDATIGSVVDAGESLGEFAGAVATGNTDDAISVATDATVNAALSKVPGAKQLKKAAKAKSAGKAVKATTKAPSSRAGKGASRGGKRNTPEQTALIKMAKKDKKTGVSKGDAKAYKELGDEAGVPVRGPESHPNRPARSSQEEHIHVGPVDHIPVKE